MNILENVDISNTYNFGLYDLLNFSALLSVNRGENSYISSGVIISGQYLLTCAHSVENITGGRVYFEPMFDPGSNEFIEIEEVCIHPDYNKEKSNFTNDIAIVKLKRSLIMNTNIPDICEVSAMSDHYVRIGHGERDNKNLINAFYPHYATRLTKQHAYKFFDNDSVVGDSGGGIFQYVNGRHKLVALHSTKENGFIYSVNLSVFKDWINNTMEKMN